MTDATSGLPAARPRKILTQIAPVAWEHPADRAALQSLRSVPGFDEVVEEDLRLPRRARRAAAVPGRRRARRADAVPQAQPALHRRAARRWTGRRGPELFVSQTPFVNAGAFGMDQPFIVINSGALSLLDDDEMRVPAGPRAGPRDERPRAVPHDLLMLLLNVELLGAAVPRRHRAPADPARAARVVPEERAVVATAPACSPARIRWRRCG